MVIRHHKKQALQQDQQENFYVIHSFIKCFVDKTKPSILCMTHQMIRKKRKYPFGSTVRYEMRSYKVMLVGT